MTTTYSQALSDWLGYLSRDEILLLKSLARDLPHSPRVVNIGAGAGTSAAAFLESRRDLYLFTVDAQKESSPFGCLDGELAELKKAGLFDPSRYQQIHGFSQWVGANWGEAPLNLVFVDGDHSYEGCRDDITAWLPRLVPGGILALHDYKKPADQKPYPGVDLAVAELLLGRYPCRGRVDTLIAFEITEVPCDEKTLSGLKFDQNIPNPRPGTTRASTTGAATRNAPRPTTGKKPAPKNKPG